MIKVGIIGFGYMGMFHFEKMKHFKEVECICTFDINDEKLNLAKEKGLSVCKTLKEFLAYPIDLVVICTPNQWHAKYAIAAMKAGKNVLCEKPATMSVKELKMVMKVSDETKKFFTVHQQRRFDPDYRVVKEIIESGKIGRITTIESRVFGERGVCFGWRANPEAGGGMLYDWGPHLIDQILQLYPKEKITCIYARVLSVLTPAVDDLFEIIMHLSNGICAKINVGTFALQKLPRWFVFGDRGTLKIDDFTGKNGAASQIKKDVKGFDSVFGQTNLGPSRTMAPLKPEFIQNIELPVIDDMSMAFWQNLVDAMHNRASILVKPGHILRQMEIVEAAFKSAKQNKSIKVSI